MEAASPRSTVMDVAHPPAERQIVLEADRVELRPLKLTNIYQHFEWNNDPELNRLDNAFPYEPESFGAFKKRFEQMIYQPAPDCWDFEIHTDEGTLIGVAHVTDLNEHDRHCTVSITIGRRDYWGEGYGRGYITIVAAEDGSDNALTVRGHKAAVRVALQIAEQLLRSVGIPEAHVLT